MQRDGNGFVLRPEEGRKRHADLALLLSSRA